jgi:hypothetical protein
VATTVATVVPAATTAPVKTVTDTVDQAATTVNNAVDQTTTAVNNGVQQVAGGTPVGQVVGGATDTVQQTTDAVTGALTGH